MRNVIRGIAPLIVGALAACSTDSGSTGPGNPVTITWAPCINDADAPSWFAVQDGTGAWTRITPTNGTFIVNVKADRIGIATYGNGILVVRYVTPAEAQRFAPTCASARRTVNGTVTGYSASDDINIQAELSGAFVSGTQAAPAAFTLSDVTPSTFDVLAVRSQSTVTGSTFQETPSSVFIRRAQNTTPLALIDLNSSAEAGAPLSQTATIANAATGENIFVVASLSTATTAIDMGSYSATLGVVTGNVTAPFYGVSSSRLIAGETQTLDVMSTRTVSSASSDSRFAAVTYATSTDKTITLGSTLGTVTVTGSARPSATYVIQSGYDQTFELDLDQGSGISARSIQIIMSRGYAGAAATQVTVGVPNLNGVSGFLSTWLVSPGTTATWTFFAAGATVDIFQRNTQSYTGASRTSSFVP